MRGKSDGSGAASPSHCVRPLVVTWPWTVLELQPWETLSLSGVPKWKENGTVGTRVHQLCWPGSLRESSNCVVVGSSPIRALHHPLLCSKLVLGEALMIIGILQVVYKPDLTLIITLSGFPFKSVSSGTNTKLKKLSCMCFSFVLFLFSDRSFGRWKSQKLR